MTLPSWNIDTDVGTITADWLEGQLFETAPGSEITATFVFVSWGAPTAPAERHAALQPLVDAAIEGTTIRVGQSGGGKPYYRENLSSWDIDSLLVSLAPDSDRRGAIWAALVNGVDATPAVADDVFVWELDLIVLADLSEYATRSEAETALKEGIQ